MKFWLSTDDRRFLSRFDAFWGKLEAIEGKYQFLSLDPRHRYWIDTYPPLTMWTDTKTPLPTAAALDLGAVSRACRHDMFSLYFHIGFCRRRCSYCRQYEINLIRHPSRSNLLRRYVEHLKDDIDASVKLFPALQGRTRDINFGGGTPSMLPPRLLGSLLEHLLKKIDLSVLSPQSTYEINPLDPVDDLFALLKAIEIPRISIGVQSFDDRTLRSVGRGYCREDIFRVIEKAGAYGFETINIDLINGFPSHKEFGQWKRELELLESLFAAGAIQSATLYLLHPFPTTNLPGRRADAYWQTRNICFAREYLCNRLLLHEKPIYWFHKKPAEIETVFAPSFSIFGYGNSSYSALGRWSLLNIKSLHEYMAYHRDCQMEPTLPIQHAFRLNPKQLQTRSLLFAIRYGAFKLDSADLSTMDAAFAAHLRNFQQDGLLERDEDSYRLTETGKIFAHQMPIHFFDTTIRKNLQDFLESRFD